MKTMRGVVISGKGQMALRDDCPLPERPALPGR